MSSSHDHAQSLSSSLRMKASLFENLTTERALSGQLQEGTLSDRGI